MSTAALALSGCSLQTTAGPATYEGAAIKGIVHGGQNPISGASIYLYAAGSPAAPSYTKSTPAGSISNVTQEASDTSGNVYVTDNGRIEEIFASSGYTTSATVGGYNSFPYVIGVAVDSSGDVFVASFGGNVIYEFVAVSGAVPSSATPVQIASVSLPRSVAVDSNKNIYVIPSGSSVVSEYTASSGYTGTPITVATGLSNPQGLTMDSSNDLFIADYSSIKEVAAVSGVVPPNSVPVVLASGYSPLMSVAVDSRGNVFFPYAGRIYKINAVNGSIPASPVITTVLSSGADGASTVTPSGDIFYTNPTFNQVLELVPNLTASVSLLTSTSGTSVDTSGNYYVSTDAGGNFTLAGDYTCLSGQPVYLYTSGGNTGAGINASATLMAVLGACPSSGNFATATPTVIINEITTVAAAYAMAGYASDSTHVSDSGSALALTGIQNAFATAGNLAYLPTGFAATTTAGGNGTPPTATVITLANILGACVNSNTGSSACTTLFADTPDSAAFGGAAATDTATAAIHLAHNPYPGATQMTALYTLPTPTTVFNGGLTSQPNDFTLPLTFTGNGLQRLVSSIAIDGSGNVWTIGFNANYPFNSPEVGVFQTNGTPVTNSPFSGNGLAQPIGLAIGLNGNGYITNHLGGTLNSGNGSISVFTLSGAAASGSPFEGTGASPNNGIAGPFDVAIDGSGHVWSTNNYGNDVSELTSAGATVSGAPYPGNSPAYVAFDASGNTWLTNGGSGGQLNKYNSSGVAATNSPFSGNGLSSGPGALAIDASGNTWVATPSAISVFTSAGAASTSPASPLTGGGLSNPYSIVFDGAGTAWIANSGQGYVSAFSSAGAALSPTTGLGAAGFPSGGYSGGGEIGIAVDGSGNVWTFDTQHGVLIELVGSATPVVTPLAANLASPYGTKAVNKP